jgi:CRISPR-associated protein Cst2
VAYTDANPIRYWDDDLFGYMRAPSKRAAAVEQREADESVLLRRQLPMR